MSLIDDIIKKNREEEERYRQSAEARRAEEAKKKASAPVIVKSNPYNGPAPTVTVSREVKAQPTLKVTGAYGQTPPRYNPAVSKGSMVFAMDAATKASVFDRVQRDEELKNKINPSRKVDAVATDLLKAVPRAPFRAAFSLSQTSPAFNPTGQFAQIRTDYGDEYIAKSPLAQFVFGLDSIGNTKQEGEKFAGVGVVAAIKIAELKDGGTLDAEQSAELMKNIKKYSALTIPLGILGLGSDLVPGVGGAKKQVTKEVAEQLIKKYGMETANEIIEKGGKELAEQAVKEESEQFLKRFVTSDADKLSTPIKESLLNNPDNVAKKPNRLVGEGYSLQEARTGRAVNGEDIPGRIIIGKTDNGDLTLKDGTHLLEAYRIQRLRIPENKIKFEDGVTYEDFLKTSAKELEPQQVPRAQLDTPAPRLASKVVSDSDRTTSKLVNDAPTVTQINKSVNELIAENRAALKGSGELDTALLKPEKLPLYTKAREAVREVFTKVRETVQDNAIRIRKLQETSGVRVADDADPYLAKKLFIGRASERLEEVNDAIKNIDQQIVKVSKALGIEDKQLMQDVNDYLIARHAPERNKALGDMAAGITDDQAKGVLKRIESSSYSKQVKKIAEQIQALNKQTLDVLYESGVITKKAYKELSENFKYHVPLNRVFDEEDDILQVLTTRGMDVKKTGLYQAKGSVRDISDVLQNVTDNLKSAVMRAEKNLVDNEIARFAKLNESTGLFTEIPYVKARKSDEQILFYFDKGVHKALRIEDRRLAAAFRGVNMQFMPPLLRFVPIYTRLYSSLATRFNPEFLLPNKIRDIQEMAVFAASKDKIGFSGAGKSVLRDPASIKSISEFMLGKNTAGARLYKQMRLDGGTTGGLGLSTKKQATIDLAKIRKTNRSSIRKGLVKTLETIDNVNQIIEDSSRLSVYKTALDRGLSRREAARLAKDATIDFNQMGTGGPIINSLYMFSNASIQGSTKMLKAMKNPKVAATVVTVVGTATALTNQHNDAIDSDWRDKVPEWDRYNNLVILLPSSDGDINYFKLPVSWGLKPIKVSMDYLYDLSQEKATIPDAIEGIMAATLDSYNPVGGTDALSTATPTPLDIPVEIGRNRAWHGGKIKPDYDPNSPEALKYFKSLTDTTSGKAFKDITKYFYKKTDGRVDVSPADLEYAFQQYIGGLGRFSSKVISTIQSVGTGEGLPKADDLPITSRFVGQKTSEEVGDRLMPAGKFYDIRDDVEGADKFRKAELKDLYAEMKQMSPEDRQKAMQELVNSGDVDAIKTIFDEFKKDAKGLTQIESSFSSASVKTRATYLIEVQKTMSPDERAELMKRLIEKGLLTRAVIEEYMKLSTSQQ